ncbi:MAG TPA: DUF190 domain-containing protein [Anaerolineaceae bacterium]|nr:DUF190 domain-containing protein [Anaerolineaceae bacterium]
MISQPFTHPQRLRIYFSESDTWRGKSLDSVILEILRQKSVAGASVFRGVAGFGAYSRIHTSAVEVLAMDLPLVIEVIDEADKLEECLQSIAPLVQEGLITLEDVRVVKYAHRLQNLVPAEKLVSEVMTKNVAALAPQESVFSAWKLMLDKQVKAMPVIDSAGKVVGILTDEDLIDRAGISQRLSVALRLDKAEIEAELNALMQSPLLVKDVITAPVQVLPGSLHLREATARMVKSGLKRMPVVDHKGSLVGMLSRLDILRQVAHVARTLPALELKPGVITSVQDVMTTEIPLVGFDEDLSSIINKFAQSASHRLIVTDAQGKAVGLISDADVITRVQSLERKSILDMFKKNSAQNAGSETASDLMSPGVLAVPPTLAVSEATRLMLDLGRKWMVVTDPEGKPLGLVDRQILLEAAISQG